MVWTGRFDYSRKLVGITIIASILAFYFAKVGYSWIIFLGGFLILEHYFVWNRWDAIDLIGHEYWAMYLLTIGFLINHFYFGLLVWVGFFIGATYQKVTLSELIQMFKDTIKELFIRK